MEEKLYICLVTDDEGQTSRFVSHHPNLYVKWPLSWPIPSSPDDLDIYMTGENAATVPMKYARGWFQQIASADWCHSVEFSEAPFYSRV